MLQLLQLVSILFFKANHSLTENIDPILFLSDCLKELSVLTQTFIKLLGFVVELLEG